MAELVSAKKLVQNPVLMVTYEAGMGGDGAQSRVVANSFEQKNLLAGLDCGL